MTVINPVGFLHNLDTHTAVIDRLANGGGLLLPNSGELRSRGGRRSPLDMLVTAQPTPNMSVRVSAGVCFVPGPTAVAGDYLFPNDGSVTLSISAAHSSLPRRDLIVARVRDSFYSGATNLGDLTVITGTANASPSDPTLPAGAAYLVLAQVTVGAGATTITNSNIVMRAAPAALGTGVLYGTSVSADGDFDGQLRMHATLGLQRWSGNSWGSPVPRVSGSLTLASGWGTYPGYKSPGYTLASDGQVNLHGVARRNGATLAVATNQLYSFATLPTAIRPPSNWAQVSSFGNGNPPTGTICRLFAQGAGSALNFIPSGSGSLLSTEGWVSLDGMTWNINP
jgi:hypothetical protein